MWGEATRSKTSHRLSRKLGAVHRSAANGREMTSDIETRREHLRCELEAARQEFYDMVASISEPWWAKPSHNPGWTNGQVLFHVLLGFILVPPLAGLLVFFGHLPAVCSRIFAAILNFSTPLFNRINAVGPRAGARLLGRAGLISKFDQVHGTILKRLERVRQGDWSLAMHYPTRWDPLFKAPMHLEDLFRYPVDHLRQHRHQLRAAQ
jgi:DinB superfamily